MNQDQPFHAEPCGAFGLRGTRCGLEKGHAVPHRYETTVVKTLNIGSNLAAIPELLTREEIVVEKDIQAAKEANVPGWEKMQEKDEQEEENELEELEETTSLVNPFIPPARVLPVLVALGAALDPAAPRMYEYKVPSSIKHKERERKKRARDQQKRSRRRNRRG